MASEPEKRGAVFTQPLVVNFMLDLIGYTTDKDLTRFRVLEPSFGTGEFLLPIVKRLLTAFRKYHPNGNAQSILQNALRGIEIDSQTCKSTQQQVMQLLINEGITKAVASDLIKFWLREGDFLLSSFDTPFSHVVGNPPYVRHELIPSKLMQIYRSKFTTIYDRADLYIPFIEHSLSLLEDGGQLSFICSDRWTKNNYGKRLRKLIASKYRLKHYVDMTNTNAFRSKVLAYCGIVTISKESNIESNNKQSITAIAKQPILNTSNLKLLSQTLNTPQISSDKSLESYKSHLGKGKVEVIANSLNGNPWLLNLNRETLQLIHRLENSFSPIESVGCQVGIGVATGNNSVFVKNHIELDIEEDRKLPLAITNDITSGDFKWGGKVVINLFDANGSLINLNKYPKLEAYLTTNKEALSSRYFARRNPKLWFRTIGKINVDLTTKKKLFIPDIKEKPTVALDEGTAYPHHNLYWITSDTWELEALRTVLKSSIARLFILAYSVKMRKGWLRFQAQNLRRIVLPKWEDVSSSMRHNLIHSKNSGDELIYELFGLKPKEIDVVKDSS